MRILLWHGYLLEGSGSNIGAARTAEALRAAGHDVLLLCQEGHPERYPWIDAWGRVDGEGPSPPQPNQSAVSSPTGGRCTLLRPDIGSLLPVFVVDEYEGFEVKTFPDLTAAELEHYLSRNADAMRAAAGSHHSEVAIVGHVIPGGPVTARGFGAGRFVVKIHGSDLEYALRPQERYRRLARTALAFARTVVGPSDDVIRRCDELTGGLRVSTRVVVPGVEVETFHPMQRREALLETAARLDRDPETTRGRPASADGAVARALADRDGDALGALALEYDQRVADPDAARRLRALADRQRPLVGFFGKLIPQKGAQLLLAGARLAHSRPDVLMVGFGLHREWLVALAQTLEAGDMEGLAWLRAHGVLPQDVSPDALPADGGSVTFTGRFDHRYAPGALGAMDVLVVPSILDEAFGMVAAEGAAAGALPLVARHSGLAEIAEALEAEVGRPGFFSFEPGPGSTRRIAEGIDRLLGDGPDERRRLRHEVSSFVARTWSWNSTAEGLLSAAMGPAHRAS
jgi:glycosyltransferase involved in cell wall biosynthesis